MKKHTATELLCFYISCLSKRLLFLFFFFVYFAISAQIKISSDTEVHITNGASFVIIPDVLEQNDNLAENQVEIYTTDNSTALNIYRTKNSVEENKLLDEIISDEPIQKIANSKNILLAKQNEKKAEALKKILPKKPFANKIETSPLLGDLKISSVSGGFTITFTLAQDYQMKSAIVLQDSIHTFSSCKSDVAYFELNDIFVSSKNDSEYFTRPPPEFS